MKSTVMNPVKALLLVTLGLAIGAMGIYVAEADDAPGAAVIGLVLMAAGVVFGVRALRGHVSIWAARTALVAGLAVAALMASLTYWVVVTTPLFAQAQDVTSVVGSAPSPQFAAAVDRARELVRTAVIEQNLPGVSVAVGVSLHSEASAKEGIIWVEGFGWRDVGTRTPVTPDTRFNIGTAAPAVSAAARNLGLTNTGAETANAWSPEAIGEEGEDFPPLTLLRHHVWQPLGLMASEYPLPGDRATFYVPRSHDTNARRGHRLMPMRDLACCANGMTFYSTPSDLVRVALATNADGLNLNGELAGGMVMSLVTRRDRGLVVAVTSNISHADTSGLAARIGEAFAAAGR